MGRAANFLPRTNCVSCACTHHHARLTKRDGHYESTTTTTKDKFQVGSTALLFQSIDKFVINFGAGRGTAKFTCFKPRAKVANDRRHQERKACMGSGTGTPGRRRVAVGRSVGRSVCQFVSQRRIKRSPRGERLRSLISYETICDATRPGVEQSTGHRGGLINYSARPSGSNPLAPHFLPPFMISCQAPFSLLSSLLMRARSKFMLDSQRNEGFVK